MSLLLSKLSSRKAQALRQLTTRSFSTSFSRTSPSSTAGCGSTLRKNDIEITNFAGWSYATEKKEMGTIGSSNGWVATLKDGQVCLQDDLNPNASDTNPKRISLPPLVTLPRCQTQIVTNVAMSTSSPEDEDCVLAVKFLGPQLSFCRPGHGSKPEWTNVRIADSSFFNSHVMYSDRDEMFSMPSSDGHYIGSWDIGEHIHNRKVHKLRFLNLPKLVQTEWELLDSCFRSEHLVESRFTGETFLVKWYTKRNSSDNGKMRTERFFVFNIDEEGNAVYTTDIGDLCIHLSKAESFCLPARLNDGHDNYINFLGIDHLGIAILDNTFTRNYDYDSSSSITGTPPYWIPRKNKID